MNDFIFSKTDKIIVLTGAGISAESGIKTFRDSNGLWENHRVEDVATPQAFKKNPVLVWNFYKQRYYQSLKAQPNNGHKALIELEMKLQDNFTLITQNVDNLHSKAGSKNIIEMHGSLNKCFCIKCQTRYSVSDINLEREIPLCPKCNNYLRPDIVWFGEIPYNLDLIEQKLKEVTIFISIGTSGQVYPAAQFIAISKLQGAKTIGINLLPPQNKNTMDYFFQGKAGELLPSLIKEWCKNI